MNIQHSLIVKISGLGDFAGHNVQCHRRKKYSYGAIINVFATIFEAALVSLEPLGGIQTTVENSSLKNDFATSAKMRRGTAAAAPGMVEDDDVSPSCLQNEMQPPL